ncbi:MAG: hypothetical protein EP318_19410 [Rhodobacteraceae bacterium]|nr:MAG: hypothetical protein EP318_19410 [Paracoccaceae bacterium]
MQSIRFALCLALLGCTQFPQLDGSEGPEVEGAAYPRLLSVEELRAIPESTTSVEVQTALLGRLRGLQARVARLRGPVIDRATRARMTRGVR